MPLYVLCVLRVHMGGSLQLWFGPRDWVAVSSGNRLHVLSECTSCSQNGSSSCALMLPHGMNESAISEDELETCFSSAFLIWTEKKKPKCVPWWHLHPLYTCGNKQLHNTWKDGERSLSSFILSHGKGRKKDSRILLNCNKQKIFCILVIGISVRTERSCTWMCSLWLGICGNRCF